MLKELAKDFSIYLFAQVFSKGLIFILWIILAWWLVPSQIGLYTLAMFLVEVFSALAIFGSDAVMMRFYQHQYKKVALPNIFFIFLFSVFFTCFLFIFSSPLISFWVSGLSDFLKEYKFLILAIIAAVSFSNFSLSHYVANRESKTYAKLQILKLVIFAGLGSLLVYKGMKVEGLFYAHFFSALTIAIYFIFSQKNIFSKKLISFAPLREMIKYSFPLTVKTVSGILVLYFGRIILYKYTSLAALGIYSFFLMLTLEVNKIWSSFNQAWTPKVFSELYKGKRSILDNIKFMTFLISFLYLISLLLLMTFGNLFLFKLIFKEIYLNHIYIFYIILLGPLFTGIYIINYPLYYYKNRTKIIMLLSFGIFAVDILLTFFMVKLYGEIGAALSFLFISIITPLIYLLVFRKIIEVPKEIINWLVILSGLMTLSVFLFLYLKSQIFFLSGIILSAFLAYKLGDLSGKRYLVYQFLIDLKKKLKK